MEMIEYIRKPFTIEAVQITEENIYELAEFIGTVRTRGGSDGGIYIEVDRRRVPTLNQVFPGYWLTRIGDNVRCYSDKVFQRQFVQLTDETRVGLAVISGELGIDTVVADAG